LLFSACVSACFLSSSLSGGAFRSALANDKPLGQGKGERQTPSASLWPLPDGAGWYGGSLTPTTHAGSW
jgi:hypothetical protein